jgi:opacity protein-like surface antigen
MKRNLLLLAALFTMSLSYSQFYAGLSGGYSFGATQRVNGTEVSLNGSTMSTSNIYGSYGEGFNGTLKLGYFFNEHLGAELNLGYLNGSDQTKADVKLPVYGMETDAIAYSRVFRSTLSLVYKINNGLYGRFGAYIPLGGKTVVEANDRRVVEVAVAVNPETGQPIMAPANVTTSYEMEIHGTPTIGFAGAIGYEYSLSDNLKLFGELEYLGLAIKTKDSEYTKYDQKVVIHLPPELGGTIINKETTLEDLGDGRYIDYVDTIKVPGDNWVDGDDYDNTKKGVDFKQSAPYDSFGFNVGIKYVFGSSSSK